MGLRQLALAVLGGNLALHQLPVLPGTLTLLALTLAALAALAVAWARRPRAAPAPAGSPVDRPRGMTPDVQAGRLLVLAATALLAFGLTGQVARSGIESRWPAEDSGDDVRLVGWIDGFPVRDSGRTLFSLRVAEAETGVPLRRVRLSWYEPAPELRPGQSLALEARLRSPRGLANPGGFDYERWLFLERYDATGYVRSGDAGIGQRFGLAQRWLELRAGLLERIGRQIGNADAAALIAALALGERGGFDDADWTVLQRTGTSHLVAVSGLHIGLVATFAFLLLRRAALGLPYRIARHAEPLAAALCIVPAAVYAALAGFALPTRRALAMLLVAQVLLVAGRRWPLGGGLAIALIAVIALDPLATLTASFWMSFGAVALLLAIAGGESRPAAPAHRNAAVAAPAWRRLGALATFCRVQWILTLGLAPLVIGYFGQVSVASLGVNLVAIPLFSLLVVPLSLITLMLLGADLGSSWLVDLTEALAQWSWRGLELAASGPFAAFAMPPPTTLALLLGLGAVAISLPLHRLPGRRLALVGALPLVLGARMELLPGEARVTVLDVGHGLAVVVETAAHRLIYDAGPRYQSGFDAGAEIVAPVLAALGPREPDLLVLSHGDSDHAGGAASLVARFGGMRVLAGPDIEDFGARECRRGDAWRFDDVAFTVLHPPAGFLPLGNESSCVVLVETVAGRLLLTGDIESRGEARLAADPAIAAEVVVVPHHGSLTSSSERFVASVGAELAIASAGYANRWGFPRPEVRARWEAAGAELLVTGDLGAIDLAFRHEGIEVVAWRHRRQRYWHAERAPFSGAVGRSAL